MCHSAHADAKTRCQFPVGHGPEQPVLFLGPPVQRRVGFWNPKVDPARLDCLNGSAQSTCENRVRRRAHEFILFGRIRALMAARLSRFAAGALCQPRFSHLLCASRDFKQIAAIPDGLELCSKQRGHLIIGAHAQKFFVLRPPVMPPRIEYRDAKPPAPQRYRRKRPSIFASEFPVWHFPQHRIFSIGPRARRAVGWDAFFMAAALDAFDRPV